MITAAFSTSSGFISRLIKWVQRIFTGRGKVSHAFACLNLGGVLFVVEATMGGVRMLTRRRWEKDHQLVAEFCVNLPDPPLERVKQALDEIGDAYDYVGLLGYVPVLFWRWLGRKVRNPLASSKSMVCSEFLARFLTLVYREQIPELGAVDPETVTPQDLLDLCSRSGLFVQSMPQRV